MLLLFLLVSVSLIWLYRQYWLVYLRLAKAHDANLFPNTPECPEPEGLFCVSGEIPDWLNGVMYRIGPGVFNVEQENGLVYSIRHAFDGLPTVHRFEIGGTTNTIRHRSRHTAKALEQRIRSGASALVFFGHLPILSFFPWLMHALSRFCRLVLLPTSLALDTASVGVTVSPNYPLPADGFSQPLSLVAKTDANLLQILDPVTLVPERLFSYAQYDPRLDGFLSAAHHQQDPVTDETFNFTMHLMPLSLKVFKTDAKGQVTLLADIKDCRSYIHSFYLTSRHVILPASPLAYDQPGNILLHGAALTSLRWHPDQNGAFYVISRDPGQPVRKIPCAPFFTFHVANAYEQYNTLYLDSASFTRPDVLLQLATFGQIQPTAFCPLTFAGMQAESHQDSFGQLVRHTLDLELGSVHCQILAENLEFPRFHSAHNTQPYRFVYGCQHHTPHIGLVKVDLHTQQTYAFHTPGTCAEPIFVPHPHPTQEDHGVLLSLLNTAHHAYWILLDARLMTEIARFSLGSYQPITFHGSFVDYEFRSISVN
ncbi:carotenoid oxygenase [Sporodiniella umbellata]|nr:carotenoid oxygenase [Sporodiniella umbellata]